MTTADLLTSAPPEMSERDLADLVRQHYELTGQFHRLTSERDLNHRLTGSAGSYVVKITNAAEPRAQTNMQTMALLHLANAGLPVPQVLPSRAGAVEVYTPAGVLRVLSYLEGTPLHAAPRSPTQTAAVARIAARLTAALAEFDHPGADHILQWDIAQAAALRPLFAHVPDDLRPLCSRVLDRFDTEIAPRLTRLPRQIVHNDLNPHNLLVAPANPDTIAGILDFGDMVRTQRVCDLAIAASYQLGDKPLANLANFTAAYHATLPLTRAELALIFDLTATRMLTTIAITAWRAARYPENAPYILRNLPTARAGMVAFATLSPDDATETLLRACAMEPL